MNWQQFLMAIVLGVAVIFVWRSSSGKKSGCGHDCNCAHEHESPPEKKGTIAS